MPSRFPLDPVALTEALVAIDSRNPDLVPGAPGEAECARLLANVLSGWGFAVSLDEIAPNRFNVTARIGPSGRSPLVLNGHLDVVGTEGMTHEPFSAERRDGRLWGRGSADMKSGVAAMCVGAARAAARGALHSEIIVAAVADEEHLSIGTRALLERGLTATGVIVTEPTRLAVCPAHKGFAWLQVELQGRAAHGSRHDVGVDAITHAALLLTALAEYDATVLTTRRHALIGRPSVHASTIEGGTGWSTYPAHCTVRIERRTVPGESGTQVREELEGLCAALAESRPDYLADVSLVAEQPPSDLDVSAPLVLAAQQALRDVGQPAPVVGLSCWTDAALFTAAGIPAICFGPGDIAMAHGAEEWVPEEEIIIACDTLERVCSQWGR